MICICLDKRCVIHCRSTAVVVSHHHDHDHGEERTKRNETNKRASAGVARTQRGLDEWTAPAAMQAGARYRSTRRRSGSGWPLDWLARTREATRHLSRPPGGRAAFCRGAYRKWGDPVSRAKDTNRPSSRHGGTARVFGAKRNGAAHYCRCCHTPRRSAFHDDDVVFVSPGEISGPAAKSLRVYYYCTVLRHFPGFLFPLNKPY